MKIVCVIDSLGPGGAQRQLVQLAKGFKEVGHEVSFLTYHSIDFFLPKLEEVNIEVQTIIESSYLLRIWKMRKAIRKQSPDVVLSFLEASNFMATLAGFPFKKWKLILGERSANPQILKSRKLRFYRYFHVFADYVVGNSKSNIDLVQRANRFLKKEKCKVIYNIPSVNNKNKIRLFPENSKTIITFAASYRKVKNLEGLIEAVFLLEESYKKRLLINWYGEIFDLNYFEKMKMLIAKYHLEEIIILHAPSKNIEKIYSESHFVALLSFYEGFPNVISEAMALGLPIIVSKVSDVPFFIKEGENGFLCEATSFVSIKLALEKAIDSSFEERKEMGTNNFNLARNIFDNKKLLLKYLELFEV